MTNNFLTVDNMKNLIQIMHNVMREKYNITLSPNDASVKNVFLHIMKKVDEDQENESMALIEKNKLTLKIVKEIVRSKSKNTPSSATPIGFSGVGTQDTNVANRDAEIYPDRHNVYDSHRPLEVKTTSVNQDISAKMKNIENTRKQENVKEVKEFNDINKTICDQSFDDADFKNKMKELESNRTTFDNKLQDMFPLSNDKDEFSFVEKRNTDMSSILNKNVGDVDPAAFFKQNNDINEHQKHTIETDQNLVPSSYKNLAMSTIIPKESFHGSKLEKRYVLINSYDRNWLVDKNRYQYKIRFSYNTNDVIKIPYYDNNPTVPHTKTEKSNGIKNDFGWVDKNGVFHDPYNPDLALSENVDSDGKFVELGFEDVEIVVDQDASMVGTFKDIYSIKITNVTIPSEIYNNYVNTGNFNDKSHYYNYNFNFPYILCNINEFQDIYDGTDDSIRKTFCQLQYDNYIQGPNGRGYIILKPVQQEIKTFYPNSLSSLPTLNISLTKPNGELLNKAEDGVSVFHIALHQAYYLKITTKTYFEKDDFCKGDYVRIKNFNLYQISTTILKSDMDLFNSFINRTEGHVIYENGDPNENGYYNSFYIYGPGSFDKHIGKFVGEENLFQTLAQFNQLLIDNDFFQGSDQDTALSTPYENGFLLNMSLQNSISMTIEMYKPDSVIMAHDKI
uniref:Uncharacterized protein n=1 Tax=Pyramimonas orientalis virus TaxID=455367 RepID=A0A7M3UNW9_POV01|nr:hypothetical protein HWQ62_00276 [Pyramimonas orientalis virus]